MKIGSFFKASLSPSSSSEDEESLYSAPKAGRAGPTKSFS